MRGTPLSIAMNALIVIAIVGVLVMALLPPILKSPGYAHASADAAQLRVHYQWLEMHRLKHDKHLPSTGGCRFVLSTWTSGVVDHSVENFDKYFTPGARDGDENYQKKRRLVGKGEDPWPTLKEVTSEDTHYVGRAQAHLATALAGPDEALMATDNEDWWTFRDGDINILFANGDVRQLSYAMLQERLGLGPLDRDKPLRTWGADSPIPECRKLAND